MWKQGVQKLLLQNGNEGMKTNIENHIDVHHIENTTLQFAPPDSLVYHKKLSMRRQWLKLVYEYILSYLFE